MTAHRLIDRIEGAEKPIAVTLARAFQDDPAFGWVFPDTARRAEVLRGFFGISAAQSLRHGWVLASREREAAALWYPPGVVTDGLLQTIADTVRLAAIFGRDLPRGLRLGEAIHAHHPKPQPYWYLRYVGVDPAAQGKGRGGAILRAGIEQAARNRCGVLLETATPTNVAIYTRLGFEVCEEWQPPGGAPTFWTMVRRFRA
ncbi:MAG: GNAT family N-acetyltransferase [Erythrobacter sp.]|jgi:GNAT superfamily N-acetyltransferase|nr:GNAT family N-acetyltransferase [Erythrobacter sp.]